MMHKSQPNPNRRWFQGPFLQRSSALGLRLAAVALLPGALVFSLLTWTLMWHTGLLSPARLWLLGPILAQLVFLATSAMAGRLLWRRGGELAAAVFGSYHALPVVSALVAVAAESMALFLVFMGIASGLVVGFGGDELVRWAPELAQELDTQAPWLRQVLAVSTGLGCALTGLALAWIALLLGYFMAEFLRVLADIAMDVKAIRETRR